MNYPCFGFTWVGPLPLGSTILLPGERHGDELYARPAHLTPAVQHSELQLNSRLYRAQERILRYDPTYVTVVGDGKTKDPVLDAALCTLALHPPPAWEARMYPPSPTGPPRTPSMKLGDSFRVCQG